MTDDTYIEADIHDSGAYYAYGMNDYDGFTAPPSLTIPEARCWVKLEHVSKIKTKFPIDDYSIQAYKGGGVVKETPARNPENHSHELHVHHPERGLIMSKIISSIPSIRYTADVAYQLEPNITVQGTLKYVGTSRADGKDVVRPLDRDDKGEMTVTNVAVSASRKSNGNSAFYRTDDFDMTPELQRAVDHVRELVNQDCVGVDD